MTSEGTSRLGRRATRPLLGVVAAVSVVAASCGSTVATTEAGPETSAPDLAFREESTVSASTAGTAISAFGVELFETVRQDDLEGNVAISPTSIGVVLAMTEPGATGDAQQELRTALRIEDPEVYHSSMNTLTAELEERRSFTLPTSGNAIGDDPPPDIDTSQIPEPEHVIRLANAAYLQHDFEFKQDYLDVIGSNYGSGLSNVDFKTDPAAVAREINGWVEERTEDRINDLIPEDALQPDTKMVLVNALHLAADWSFPFLDGDTVDDEFFLFDGSSVEVPMMAGEADVSVKGTAWVAARKRLMGDLYFDVVVPEQGRFEEVVADVDEAFNALADPDIIGPGGDLWLPRFETRSTVRPARALQAMGIQQVFKPGNLRGMADSDRLLLDEVFHETFLAVDETGVEAAAATAAVFREVGGYIGPTPPPVRVDRPFFYRIVDDVTGATLFIGQVTDPTAG